MTYTRVGGAEVHKDTVITGRRSRTSTRRRSHTIRWQATFEGRCRAPKLLGPAVTSLVAGASLPHALTTDALVGRTFTIGAAVEHTFSQLTLLLGTDHRRQIGDTRIIALFIISIGPTVVVVSRRTVRITARPAVRIDPTRTHQMTRLALSRAVRPPTVRSRLEGILNAVITARACTPQGTTLIGVPTDVAEAIIVLGTWAICAAA